MAVVRGSLEGWGNDIIRTVNDLFLQALNWIAPKDPLVLDLDGDGIEAVGIDPTRPILFDHDGDGTRNATGWIKGDDGIVVLDRNGNGLIDSGRELFGDQTLREGAQAGQGMFYANGYEALAGQDGNGDGVIDAADTAYGQLRIWKDVNQDGISQVGELHTLSDLGIARLNVKGQRSSIDLGNGNTQPWSGSFTRMDGSQGMSGVAEVSGSLLLASNNFYREFPDDPVPTAAAQALPQMGGAGWARDLREAMSLGNDKSQALQEKVQAFAAGTTRDAQMAAVDGLITEWARSSGKLVETLRFHSLYFDAATHQWDIATPDTPIDPRHLPGTEGTLSVDMPDVGTLWTDPATGQQRPLTEEDRTALYKKLNALEVFNGTRFVTFDRNVRPDSSEGSGGTPVGGSSGSGNGGGGSGGGGSGAEADLTYRVSARISTTQLELLAQSYEQLRESVYAALVTQTRLRPYLDSVELLVDEKGIRFDTSALSSMLEAKKGASERDGLIDLVELIEYQGPVVGAVGFDGVGLLSRWIESLPADAPLRSELPALRVFMATATTGSDRNDIYLGDNGANSFSSGAGDDWLRGLEGNDHLAAGSGNDVLEGGAGDDSLQGQAGNDRLLGGEGADVLQGGDGDDVLEGGAGNDILAGGVYDTWNGNYSGAGNDTYLFGRGDGQDIIIDDDATVGNLDKLVFKTGVAVADVLAVRDGDALILKINGTTDQVRIDSYFSNDGMNNRQIEEIRFTDSATTVWKLADIKARMLTGTAGNDTIIGYATADTINGDDGNDTLEGRGGNDLLEGGAGNDSLYGQAGNDRLLGGDGADVLQGGDGDDVLDGGAGNDILAGGVYDTWNGSFRGAGNDTYLFGRGDGQDTIYNDDAAAGHLDKLVFKAGVKPADVQIERQDNELVLRIAGSDDQVRVINYFLDDAAGGWALGGIGFEDDAQTLWSVQDVKLMALQGTAGGNRIVGYASDDTLQGLDGNDTLEGRGGNDLLEGGAGNDSLYGQAGNDRLLGGDGADVLQGGDGDDVLDGGAGNDILAGGVYDTWNGSFRGAGNDTYLFGRGSQADRIVDEDSTPGNVDVLSVGPGVATDQLWFRREGNDLEVSIIGTEDRATIANWYAGSANHLEKIQTSDGKVLLDSQVDALVSAMAAFAPPAAGQTTLPNDYATTLQPKIAANWQ
ncbi:putative rtx family calcium-binding cytotoxins and bacteriocins protein [Paracidovorax avenae ATCC 19860]|uniref:Putative rtx family calcium-binding cytotoxins and bacteriocins protein n=2 Tax=Pseudomonadota TaxID=1224 RepID=F0Q9P3_PARA1|nr:putative rtx family calcium-binding cytotoxins and bacteriocins protein [Paracidovorax avenae ATCC 19860]